MTTTKDLYKMRNVSGVLKNNIFNLPFSTVRYYVMVLKLCSMNARLVGREGQTIILSTSSGFVIKFVSDNGFEIQTLAF